MTENETNNDNEDGHVNVIHTTNDFPAPEGSVPSIFQAIPLLRQRLQSEQFFEFAANPDADLLQFNADVVPRTALICLPRSSKVKVVYCPGRGSSPIGEESPLENKHLFLTGDADQELGDPTPVVLNENVFQTQNVAVMTHEQFSTALTDKGPTYRYPLIQRRSIATANSIMKAAPVPAYIVYDGFHRNLDAAEVYERLLTINTDDNDMFEHLKRFLRACLGAHNADDAKPWVSQDDLFQPLTTPAKRWAKQKFKSLFPTLTQTLPTLPAAPAPNAQSFGLTPALAEALTLALTQAPRTVTRPAPQNVGFFEEKKDEGDHTSGMSEHEFGDLMLMCGNPADGDALLLPEWVTECAKKGSESYRLTTIMKHIMKNTFYDDAEVPITRPLLKMILKRNWTGKDGNISRPSMANSSEGLSIFSMIDMDEDEVARINAADDAITKASLLTFADLQQLKNARKTKVPESADEFMLTLKRFANLLFALFSVDCPLFKCIKKVVDALKKYSRSARLAMSKTTKASIMWIVLLQSRQFSIGHMEVLAEFQLMHTSLTSKQGQVLHAEVPQELLEEPPVKRNRPNSEHPRDTTVVPPTVKPTAKPNPNCWHPKLKAALEGPMNAAKDPNLPGFQKILTFCKVDTDAVLGKGSNACSPNLFFGRCFHGTKCRKVHRVATDSEAEEILKLVQPFIKDPTSLKRGQSKK